MTCKPGRRKLLVGFTLVELLVVVGIIALLVAMLLPALAKARLSALRIACMSNMRQTVMALTFYANDFREYPYNAPPGQGTVLQPGIPPGEPLAYNAPWGQGLLGSPAQWRGHLLERRYAPFSVLGCANPLPDGNNIYNNDHGNGFNYWEVWPNATAIAQTSKTPPFLYFGPGVDPFSVAEYYTGFPGQYPFVRHCGSYKLKKRHPLLFDAYVRVVGEGDLTPHARVYSHADTPVLYTTRRYDHTLGWSDGSVELCLRNSLVPIGNVRLFDYVWQ